MSINMTTPLIVNPVTTKLESGYSASGTLTIPNNGSAEPTVITFENWMNKTVGARSTKGNFDSALYVNYNVNSYPKYVAIDGVVGIASRDPKTTLTYTITVIPSTLYKITITGSTSFSMTSSGSATAAEIVSSLVGQINADSGCKAVASGTTTLILTRKDVSIPFAVYNPIDYNPNSYTGYDTAGNSAGSGVNMLSDLGGLTGFIKSLPNVKDFFVGYQMGVPNGYFFSGASTINTRNAASNIKQAWMSDNPLDDAGRADIVCNSRPNTSQWATLGNQSNGQIYTGDQVDFGKLNTFLVFHKSGASPFTDNGVLRTIIAGQAGAVSYEQTNKPLFVRRTSFTVTAISSTLYTITIAGTVCTYMSDASATIAEINEGLRADIAYKISTSIGAPIVSEGCVRFDPVSGTMPTITVGANITMFDLLPQFSQYSSIWHGNNNQVNTMHVKPWLYIAHGVNCGNYVALGNASTWAAVTDFKIVKHTTWSSSESQHSKTDLQSAGKTHWFRFVDNVVVMSGAL
jgi:hypothetical protein